MKLRYIVPKENKYANLKEVLKVEFGISDRLLLTLKKLQKIYLNNEIVYVHHMIKSGDLIVCDLDYEEDNSNIVPTSIPLSILYEDECYLVIDKPSGIPVHSSCNHYADSLSNGVCNYFRQIGLKKKLRPVNRLDKDTSGIVIFAKNEYVQEALIKQMKSKEFIKKYITIVEGHLSKKEGTICAPIAREKDSIIKRCVREDGENSITHYKVIKSLNDNFDVVECRLETGRTHQIRVHFSHLGHSILGDTLYGTSSFLISRQALHCYFMSFIHPISNKRVDYISNLPKDISNIIEKR